MRTFQNILFLFLPLSAYQSFSQEISMHQIKKQDEVISEKFNGGKLTGEVKEGKKVGIWTFNEGTYTEIGVFKSNELTALKISGSKKDYNLLDNSKLFFLNKTSANTTSIIVLQFDANTTSSAVAYTNQNENIETSYKNLFKTPVFNSEWTTFFSDYSDSSYGVKKVNEYEFEDKSENKYSLGYASFKLEDSKASIKILTDDTKISYLKFDLTKVVKYSFKGNSNINEIKGYCKLNILSQDEDTRFGSNPNIGKSSIASASIKKLSEDNYRYEMFIDEKAVVQGFFNSEGNMVGEWKTFYFPCLLNGQKKFFAGALKNRTNYHEIFNLSFIPPYVLGNPAQLNNPLIIGFEQQLSKATLQKILLSEMFDVLIFLDHPYEYTSYGTLKKEKNEYNLVDIQPYHMFQKNFFDSKSFLKGYQYAPDGKIFDSLNYTKDEYGELATKENRKFNPFPDHVMRKQIENKMYSEITRVFQPILTKLNEKKEYKCFYCNNPIKDNTTAIVSGDVKCGETSYMIPERIFCSTKCKFEYEAGFCRDK